MKNIYTLFFFLFIFFVAQAQMPGACGKNNLPSPQNGNASLGQSYNNSACGLNYVHADKLIETRYNQYSTSVPPTLGSGLPTNISVIGIPATAIIDKAHAYYIVAYTETVVPTTNFLITNPNSVSSTIPAATIGTDAPKCWSETGTAVYRADITAAISGNGNYFVNVTGLVNPDWEVDGISLVIIYKDLFATYQGSFTIWDGAITEQGPTAPVQNISGLNICSTPSNAKAFALSSDHQDNISTSHSTTLNSVAGTFPNNFWSWDQANVTLTSSQTTSAFDMDGSGGSDCYGWCAMGLYYQTTNCTFCSPCSTTVAKIDSVKNVSACLGNDGAIFISDSTSAAPLTYSWSNGATTQNITGLAPGNYSVTITDANNCSIILNASIYPPSNNIFIQDSVTPSSCSASSGAVWVNVTGGNSPYTFLWSNGATTQNISGISVGNYSVIVTDASGCTSSLAAVVSYPNPILLSLSSSPDSCSFNTGTANCSVSGGSPPYTFSWSNGGTAQFITGVSGGNYSVTITDANGCTANSFISVSFASPQQPNICMVTVDSISKNNIIMWDKTAFSHVDSFVVFREIATNNYQRIGAIPYDSLSLFVDTVRAKYFPNTGDPNAGTYRYKIGVSDSCGSKSAFSPYHNTIYIINNSGAFSWNQLYTIENSSNPVNSYILMRDDNSTGAWHAVNSVSGTQQTVVDPNYPTYQSTGRWRVETQWNISCNPTKINPQIASFNSSRSNIFSNVTSVNEIDLNNYFSIFTNPST